MMEFVRNCYMWVVENYKEITMMLTSAQFISVVSAIVIFVKNIKSSKDNTAATNALNRTMATTNKMSETVTNLKTELETLKAENAKIKSALHDNQKEIIDFLNTHSAKLNSMLEVQSVVYSTIKDEKIRNTVNSLLLNAKYSESISRAKLQKEVESLRDKVAEKMSDVQTMVDNTANVVKGIVDPNLTTLPNVKVEDEYNSSPIVRY